MHEKHLKEQNNGCDEGMLRLVTYNKPPALKIAKRIGTLPGEGLKGGGHS